MPTGNSAVEVVIQANDKASQTVNKIGTSFHSLSKEAALTDKAIQAADSSIKLLSASADFAKVKFIESGIAVTGFGNAVFGASAGAVLSLGGVAKAIVQIRELAQSPIAQPIFSLLAQQAEEATKEIAPLSEVLREAAGVAGSFGQGVKEGLGIEKLFTPEKVKSQVKSSFDELGDSLYSSLDKNFGGFFNRAGSDGSMGRFLQRLDSNIARSLTSGILDNALGDGPINSMLKSIIASPALQSFGPEFSKQLFQGSAFGAVDSIISGIDASLGQVGLVNFADQLAETTTGSDFKTVAKQIDATLADTVIDGAFASAIGEGAPQNAIKQIAKSPAIRGALPEFVKSLTQGSFSEAIKTVLTDNISSAFIDTFDSLDKTLQGNAAKAGRNIANELIEGLDDETKARIARTKELLGDSFKGFGQTLLQSLDFGQEVPIFNQIFGSESSILTQLDKFTFGAISGAIGSIIDAKFPKILASTIEQTQNNLINAVIEAAARPIAESTSNAVADSLALLLPPALRGVGSVVIKSGISEVIFNTVADGIKKAFNPTNLVGALRGIEPFLDNLKQTFSGAIGADATSGLGSGIVALQDNIAGVSNRFDKFLISLKSGFGDALQGAAVLVEEVFQGIASGLELAKTGVLSFQSGIVGAVGFIDNLQNGVASFASSFLSQIDAIAAGIDDGLADFLVLGSINIFSGIISGLEFVKSGLLGLNSILSGVVSYIPVLQAQIAALATSATAQIGVVGGIFENLIETIRGFSGDSFDSVVSGLDAISASLSPIQDTVIDFISNIQQSIGPFASSLATNLETVFQQIATTSQGAFREAILAVTEYGAGVIVWFNQNLAPSLGQAFKAIDKFFGGILSQGLQQLGNNAATAFGKGFVGRVYEAIAPAIDQIDRFVLSTYNKLSTLSTRLSQPIGAASAIPGALAGFNEPLEVMGIFEELVGGATQGMFALTEKITFFSQGMGALQSFVATGPFRMLIGQTVELREQLLATQASLVGTSKVIQDGMEIKDPTKAIQALGKPIEQTIKQMRTESLELVGVTSNDLVPLFQIIAGQISSVGGGLGEAKDLTLDMAASLGTLGIPLGMARQEITSIMTQQIDANSALAKSLNINNEMVRKWKEQGIFVEKLRESLSAFRAGNKLAAASLSGVTSNITEIFDEIGRRAGEKLLDPLVKELTGIYDYLQKNQEAFVAYFSRITDAVLKAGLAVADSLKTLFGGVGNFATVIPTYLVESFANAVVALGKGIAFTIDILQPAINLLAQMAQAVLPMGGMFLEWFVKLKALETGINAVGRASGILTKILPGVGDSLFLIDQRSSGVINQFVTLKGIIGTGASGFLLLGKNLEQIPGAMQMVSASMGPMGVLFGNFIPQIATTGIQVAGLIGMFPVLGSVLGGILSMSPALVRLVQTGLTGLSVGGVAIGTAFTPLGPVFDNLVDKLSVYATATDRVALINEQFKGVMLQVGKAVLQQIVSFGLLAGGAYLAFLAIDKFILKNQELLQWLGQIGESFAVLGKMLVEVLISPIKLVTNAFETFKSLLSGDFQGVLTNGGATLISLGMAAGVATVAVIGLKASIATGLLPAIWGLISTSIAQWFSTLSTVLGGTAIAAGSTGGAIGGLAAALNALKLTGMAAGASEAAYGLATLATSIKSGTILLQIKAGAAFLASKALGALSIAARAVGLSSLATGASAAATGIAASGAAATVASGGFAALAGAVWSAVGGLAALLGPAIAVVAAIGAVASILYNLPKIKIGFGPLKLELKGIAEISRENAEAYRSATNDIAESAANLGVRLQKSKKLQEEAEKKGIRLTDEQYKANKTLRRETENQIFTIEGQIKTLQEAQKQWGVNKEELKAQVAELERTKAALDAVTSSIQIAPKELPRLGTAFEQFNDKAKGAMEALENPSGDPAIFKQKAEEVMAVTEQQLKLGAITKAEAADRFKFVASLTTLDAETQTKAQEALTKVYQEEGESRVGAVEKQTNEIKSLSASGEIGEYETERRITENKKAEIQVRLDALKKAKEEEDAIRNKDLQNQLSEIDKQIASALKKRDDAAAKNGKPVNEQGVKEANDSLISLQRKRVETKQQIDAATAQSDRKYAQEKQKLDTESAESSAKLLKLKNAEEIKDFDEKQKALDAKKSQGVLSEQGYIKQSLENSLAKNDEELSQAKEALNKLQSSDKEGREAINAKIAELTTQRQKILADANQKEISLIERLQRKAQDIAGEAESERLSDLQKLRNEGLVTEAEFNQKKVNSDRERINSELAAEQDKLAKLQALPQPNDPEEAEKLESQIRASRGKTKQFTLSLLKNEKDAYDAHLNTLSEAIKRQSTQEAIARQKAVNSGALSREDAALKEAESEARSLQKQINAQTKDKDKRLELEKQYQDTLGKIREARISARLAQVNKESLKEQIAIQNKVNAGQATEEQAALARIRSEMKSTDAELKLRQKGSKEYLEVLKKRTEQVKQLQDAEVAAKLAVINKQSTIDQIAVLKQVASGKAIAETASRIKIQNELKATEAELKIRKVGTKEYLAAEQKKYELIKQLQDAKIAEKLAQVNKESLVEQVAIAKRIASGTATEEQASVARIRSEIKANEAELKIRQKGSKEYLEAEKKKYELTKQLRDAKVAEKLAAINKESLQEQIEIAKRVASGKAVEEEANVVKIQNETKANDAALQIYKKGTKEYQDAELKKYELIKQLREAKIAEKLAQINKESLVEQVAIAKQISEGTATEEQANTARIQSEIKANDAELKLRQKGSREYLEAERKKYELTKQLRDAKVAEKLASLNKETVQEQIEIAKRVANGTAVEEDANVVKIQNEIKANDEALKIYKKGTKEYLDAELKKYELAKQLRDAKVAQKLASLNKETLQEQVEIAKRVSQGTATEEQANVVKVQNEIKANDLALQIYKKGTKEYLDAELKKYDLVKQLRDAKVAEKLAALNKETVREQIEIAKRVSQGTATEEQANVVKVQNEIKANDEALKVYQKGTKEYLDAELKKYELAKQLRDAKVAEKLASINQEQLQEQILLQKRLNKGEVRDEDANVIRQKQTIERIKAELALETVNKTKILELRKSLAEAEGQLQDAIVAKKKADLERQNQALQNTLTKQNQALEKQLNLHDSISKALDNRSRLLDATKDFTQAIADGMTNELDVMASLETSEYKKRQLAETGAAIKLRALQKQLEFEKESLMMQQEQNKLALERETIQARINAAQAEADTAKARADLAIAEADPKTTKEQRNALRLQVEAAQMKQGAYNDQLNSLGQQAAIQEQINRMQLQSFDTRAQGQMDKATADYINTLTPGLKQRASRMFKDEIAQRSGYEGYRDFRESGVAMSRQEMLQQLFPGIQNKGVGNFALEAFDPELGDLKEVLSGEQFKSAIDDTQTKFDTKFGDFGYNLPNPFGNYSGKAMQLPKELTSALAPPLGKQKLEMPELTKLNSGNDKFVEAANNLSKMSAGGVQRTYNVTVNVPGSSTQTVTKRDILAGIGRAIEQAERAIG